MTVDGVVIEFANYVADSVLSGIVLLPFAAFVDCLRLAADEGDASRHVRIR